MKARTAAAAAALMGLLCAATLTAQTPVALKYTELGHGPTVVFVHGLGGSRMQWMPTVRKLITDHHVVLVDLPGHGESPMPDAFSFAACAAALDQVLAKQQGDSTVVVGHGLGGLHRVSNRRGPFSRHGEGGRQSVATRITCGWAWTWARTWRWPTRWGARSSRPG